MKTAIVDDDQIVCSSLCTILEHTSTAQVLWTANTGSEAIDRYFASPASHPDVLLLDIQMDGMSGLETAQEILRRDRAARILFLTTFSDRDYIDDAIALGAKGYLIKQDVASVGPALQAVMAGQIVLGAEVLDKLSNHSERTRSNGYAGGEVGSIKPETVNQNGEPVHVDQAAFDHLTEREREIAALVSQGLDNHSIAAALFLSEGTIRNRISTILTKLGMTNRTQLAVAWLNTHGNPR